MKKTLMLALFVVFMIATIPPANAGEANPPPKTYAATLEEVLRGLPLPPSGSYTTTLKDTFDNLRTGVHLSQKDLHIKDPVAIKLSVDETIPATLGQFSISITNESDGSSLVIYLTNDWLITTVSYSGPKTANVAP